MDMFVEVLSFILEQYFGWDEYEISVSLTKSSSFRSSLRFEIEFYSCDWLGIMANESRTKKEHYPTDWNFFALYFSKALF